MDKCPLCNRDLGNELVEEHHLIPKSQKGKETVKLHSICHRKIHSLFTEKELSKYYNTIDKLKQNEDIKTFINWLQNKPLNFYISTKDEKSRKNKRKF
jgi:Asp-tRNA(Asn)/Glu-tRNA(Gln) amidotransferase B subunit